MKDILKTTVLVIILLVILTITFFIVSNAKNSVELLNRTKLVEKDPTVTILNNRLSKNKSLRKASVQASNLQPDEIMKYILDNIEKEDVQTEQIKANKISCNVSSTLSFHTSNKVCDFIIIDNETLMNYQKKYFNTEKKLELEELEYNQYLFKKTNKKYYFLIEQKNNSSVGYSLFKEAYQEKDKVVIYEYYLPINLNNKEKCLNLLNKEYCDNFQTLPRYALEEDIIKNKGILYKHIFKENEDNYYLEQSSIVSER